MKRSFALLISIFMTLSLLLTSVGAVEAIPMPTTTTLPDPQFSPASGAPKFTSEFVAIENLPGITTLDDGMLVPVGFASGTKQFEGVGVKVSGLVNGMVKACFPITGISSGWGGQIGMWNGSKWEMLATKISAADEAPYSWACADISVDGNYALLKWVADPSKLPSSSVCPVASDYLFEENYGYAFGAYMGFDVPDSIPNGTPVTYTVYGIDPGYPGVMTAGTSGSTTVADYFSHAAIFPSAINFSVTPWPTYWAHFVFPTLGCTLDLKYDPSFLSGPGDPD